MSSYYDKCSFCKQVHIRNAFLRQTNSLFVLKSRENFVFAISLSRATVRRPHFAHICTHSFFHPHSVRFFLLFYLNGGAVFWFTLHKPYLLSTAFRVNCRDASCIQGFCRGVFQLWLLFGVISLRNFFSAHSFHSYCWSFRWLCVWGVAMSRLMCAFVHMGT